MATASLGAGCDSAEVLSCAPGTRVKVGPDQYCVYDAASFPRMPGVDAGFACPREVPYEVVLDGARVCSSRPIEPSELPPDVCDRVAGGCATPSDDAGVELDASRPDATRDAATDAGSDASRPDAGPPPGGPLAVFQAIATAPPYAVRSWFVSVDDPTRQQNVTDAIDQALGSAPGAVDGDASLSRDGRWLVVLTTRFGCDASKCVAVAPMDDLAALTPVETPARLVGTQPSISPDGDSVVFADPDFFGLLVVRRERDAWSSTTRFGAGAGFEFTARPRFSFDGSRVLYSCGDRQYGYYSFCRANLDDTDAALVLARDAWPGSTAENGISHPGDAPDGSYVFAADWIEGAHLFRYREGAGAPVRLTSTLDRRENDPCVLPDGRTVAWTQDPGPAAFLVFGADGELLDEAPAPAFLEGEYGELTSCGG